MSATAQQDLPAPGHLHSAFETHLRELAVISAERLTPDVIHIVLAHPDGRTLTSFEPGSHLVVHAGDRRNAYSLVGDGINPRSYRISVLRQGTGGGSHWLHENLRTGSTVQIEGPRSMFSPDPSAKKLLLVAAGIGITPVLSHALAAARWDRPAEVIYIYRPGFAAHLDDLRELAYDGAIDLHEAHGRLAGIELMRRRFPLQPFGTHAYACGPLAMLDAYRTLGLEAGWPEERLHLERFEAPQREPGNEFTVKVSSTGELVTVPPGISLLERLLEAGHAIPNLCRQGVCGECRIPVRSGRVHHRDLVLNDEEKNAQTEMLCCVSRGEEIEVDL
ncbi:PDR/VanB family oxidoreductase [Arthrobacter sp. W4I7]|uniref:PDR/VanB family oxidoreductase n=1 Tax=Arthrobacter sp. W4I7 TaxID=3042296 RepID=UPI002781E53F|nr:PDR/VanB family oxidoreductase [Arthrobacter sp. W4I7]MDQ0689469.1 ferredoxin-NADP reductase [Arthrobacter sp. W4I7]